MRSLVTTRSGVRIGLAYVPKPERQSADAERVQRALLARHMRLLDHIGTNRPTWLAWLFGWLKA